MKKSGSIAWFYCFLGLLAAFCLYVGIGGLSYTWTDRVYRRLCAAHPGTRSELERLLPVCRTKSIRLEDSNCLWMYREANQSDQRAHLHPLRNRLSPVDPHRCRL